jgi:hypothetical protein
MRREEALYVETDLVLQSDKAAQLSAQHTAPAPIYPAAPESRELVSV